MAGNREIFADTSGLYASVDRRDPHHVRAVSLLGDLARRHCIIVTSDYLIAETINLAMARRGRVVAERLLDLIESSKGIRLIWVGTEHFTTAKAFFRKYADQGYSFTDCTSFVIMRELGIADALTTDRHFAAAGFRPLLTQD